MNGKEDIRTKVALLLLDKLVLALLITGAGFFFNFLLQQEKTRGDYQKQIFDRRVQAYVAILEEAKRARGQLAILYEVQSESYTDLGVWGQKTQLEELLQRSKVLDSGIAHASRRGTFRSHTAAIESLALLEQAVRDNDLYISQRVRQRVVEFLDVAVSDLTLSIDQDQAINNGQVAGSDQTGPPNNSGIDKSFQESAWQRAEEAYQLLLEEIRASLQIEGIPLG